MRIGETQSGLFDYKGCLSIANGEMYENYVHLLLNKPLDTGRMFYAKLRNAVPRKLDVEVYWNHFDNELTGVMTGRSFEYEISFKDPVMARTDKVVYIEAIVDKFKEASKSSQQLPSSVVGQPGFSVHKP